MIEGSRSADFASCDMVCGTIPLARRSGDDSDSSLRKS
jgi:hypothetical protein